MIRNLLSGTDPGHEIVARSDRGDEDNTYGEGGIQLVDYQAGTIWIDRNFGNSTNLRRWPFYTLQAAHDNAPFGGRLLAINAPSYPDTATLNKFLTIDVIGGTKTFGN